LAAVALLGGVLASLPSDASPPLIAHKPASNSTAVPTAGNHNGVIGSPSDKVDTGSGSNV